MPQLKINIKQDQFDAIARVAAERDLAKATLLRETIAELTGVPNGYRKGRWVPGLQGKKDGWARRQRKNDNPPT